MSTKKSRGIAVGSSDPTQPLVELKLGNDTMHLVFDLDAIAEAEDLTDRSLLTGMQPRDVTRPTISLVRALLYAGLRRHQPQIGFEDVKEIVTRKTLYPIWEKVLEAYTFFCAEADEGEEATPADPTGEPSPAGSGSGATSGRTPASTSA
jgi:hypothetical protein